MTREQVKELLPFIAAYAEGKTIQGKLKDYPADPWEDVKEFPNGNGLCVYRIKPEPREFWLSRTSFYAKDMNTFGFVAYPNKQPNCENIHVREVLD
jgi:hypothetical protein